MAAAPPPSVPDIATGASLMQELAATAASIRSFNPDHLRQLFTSDPKPDLIPCAVYAAAKVGAAGFVFALRAVLDNAPPGSIDAMYTHGFTPLVLAVTGHDAGAVRLLLASGADVSVRCRHKGMACTALHAAAAMARSDILQQLLETASGRACIDSVDSAGSTALHRAAMCGRVEAVRVLLAAGADPRAAEGGWCSTPLFAAVCAACTAGADAPGAEPAGQQQGSHHLEAIELLLKAGAGAGPAAAPASDSDTCPLAYSTVKGRLDVVQLLLQAAAPATARSFLWKQALLMACSKGHAAVAQCLLSSEHSPLTVDEVQPALILAVTAAAEGGGSFHAAAQLLLHLQRRGCDAAALIRESGVLSEHGVPLRVAMLQSWATQAGSSGRELDALLAQQAAVAATQAEMRELFVAFAVAEKAAAAAAAAAVDAGAA